MKSIAKGSKSNSFFGSETYEKKMSKRGKVKWGLYEDDQQQSIPSIWLSEFNSTCTSWLGVVSRGKHEQYRSSIELVSFTSCAGVREHSWTSSDTDETFSCFSIAESIREEIKIKRRFSMFSISRHLPGFEHLFLRFHNIRWEAIVKNRLILILFLLPCFALNSLGSSPRYYLHLYIFTIYSTRNSHRIFRHFSLFPQSWVAFTLCFVYFFFFRCFH